MTPAGFLRLALQTVAAPREVARLLLAMRLSREAILTALALAVVLNGLVAGISFALVPAEALPAQLGPVFVAGILALELAVTIVLLGVVGRALGGTGRDIEIALLLAWFHVLRALAQLVVLLAGLLSSALGSLLLVAALMAGVWILINFLEVAHGFSDLWKALLLLVIVTIALAFAMVLLLVLAGVSPETMAG
ncbi:MAG: YIP1 family protein [Salipiger thiooxidans]|uniref:YIP1 family protein n=1 Tax=Salipiger thiooxidans TaxID=282683 RepID=UPI001A907490|nr:YIP1 family protein [Salipiger thiooxidans]MBN8186286.1 YIP1 family protein [Salipiger thiooxidans]MBR9836545.1 YIP1 family protein [Paracoccaceae bacterium]